MREMRASARLARTPWVLFALTLTLGLLMCSIGGLAAASDTTPATIGGALFQVFFSIAYLVVVLVGPAVAANGIASEREGRTWEAVLLTGLRPQDVARGKFMAAYTTIALYIVVLAPVGALSFLFGGVTATEVVVAFVFLFLVAGLAVAFGLAVSSLMSSLRGAIVVTLMLAILIGPILYFIFGFGASFGIHKLWNEVPEAFPIWLPLAYSRGTLGLEYVLLLLAVPLLVIATPAWFLYEATIANLSGEADDRSTGLKRWFFFCTPLIAIACAVPSAVADDDEARMALSVMGLSTFALYLAFCAFLFAGEPPGPSRRVRIHWERERAGLMKRFFGPGLPKTGMMVAAIGFGCVWLIAFADMGLIEVFGSSSKKSRYIEEVFFFGLYTAGFFLFVTGLTAWLRSRKQTPWIARLVAAALLFLISAGPWVVAAIGGVLAQRLKHVLRAIASIGENLARIGSGVVLERREHARQLTAVGGAVGQFGRDDDVRRVVHRSLGVVAVVEATAGTRHNPAVRIREILLRRRLRFAEFVFEAGLLLWLACATWRGVIVG